MQLNDGFNFLKVRMDTVMGLLGRMAVEISFASDVRKLDCDDCFCMLFLDPVTFISPPIQDQPGVTSHNVSLDKAADEVRGMADVAMIEQLLMSRVRGWLDTVATGSLFELSHCVSFGTVLVSACRFRNVRLRND